MSAEEQHNNRGCPTAAARTSVSCAYIVHIARGHETMPTSVSCAYIHM